MSPTVIDLLWKHGGLRLIHHFGGWKLGWEDSREREGEAWMCKHCWSGPVACHSPCTAAWPPTLSGLCTMGGPVLNCMSSHPPHPSSQQPTQKGQKESKHPGRTLLLYCTDPGKSHGLRQPSNECVPHFPLKVLFWCSQWGSIEKRALTEAPKDNFPQQTRKAIIWSH